MKKTYLLLTLVLGFVLTGCTTQTTETPEQRAVSLITRVTTDFNTGYTLRDTSFLTQYENDVDVPNITAQLNQYFTKFSPEVLTFDAEAYFYEFYTFDVPDEEADVEDGASVDDVVDATAEEVNTEDTTVPAPTDLRTVPYRELRFNADGIAYVVYRGRLMEVPFDYITPTVELLELAPRYYFIIEDLFVTVDAKGTGNATVFLTSRYDNSKVRIDYTLKKGKLMTMGIK